MLLNLNLFMAVASFVIAMIMFFMPPVTAFYVVLGCIDLVWTIVFGLMYADDMEWIDLG